MTNTLLVSVDELWLKGKNRPLYVKSLVDHIRHILRTFHKSKFDIRNENQRLILSSVEEFSHEALEGLLLVPGIFSISEALSCAPNVEALNETALKVFNSFEVLPKTFRASVHRIDKRLPFKSPELARDLGGVILKNFEIKVDLHNPEFNLQAILLPQNFYVVSKTYYGVGGLPVGTSGHVVTLLSGGFDSPVASYLMSKRGCQQTFVFFHAYPYVGDEVLEKIKELSGKLGKYQRGCKLYVVPFGEVQKKISGICKPDYRTSFFRKSMIETASILADRVKADALCTGDALGQVSSQTIRNMELLDLSTRKLILRPLIGMNKAEILEHSKRIDTHDISVRPHNDACSMFAPKHPIIKPNPVYWRKFTDEAQLDELHGKCVDQAKVFSCEVNGQVNCQV